LYFFEIKYARPHTYDQLPKLLFPFSLSTGPFGCSKSFVFLHN
jgi:hypothetical protein